MDKRIANLADAVAGIGDGATVMIGGFGGSGAPIELIHALIDKGPKNLTVINNNAGNGRIGIAAMIDAGLVKKMICSFPRSSDLEPSPIATLRARSSWNWYRRARSPSAFAPAAPASRPSTPRPASARNWPKAR